MEVIKIDKVIGIETDKLAGNVMIVNVLASIYLFLMVILLI